MHWLYTPPPISSLQITQPPIGSIRNLHRLDLNMLTHLFLALPFGNEWLKFRNKKR